MLDQRKAVIDAFGYIVNNKLILFDIVIGTTYLNYCTNLSIIVFRMAKTLIRKKRSLYLTVTIFIIFVHLIYFKLLIRLEKN